MPVPQAGSPVSDPAEPAVCRYCGDGIGVHDDDAWDEWTTILTLHGADPALCHQSPTFTHEPRD